MEQECVMAVAANYIVAMDGKNKSGFSCRRPTTGICWRRETRLKAFIDEFHKVEAAFDQAAKEGHPGTFEVDGLQVTGVERIELQIDSVSPIDPTNPALNGNYTIDGGCAEFASASSTRWGGAVGVGWEWGFAPNWSAGIEYDHLFMGDANNSFSVVNPIVAGALNRISQDVDMVTVRVNYRFGWGGAAVPRYWSRLSDISPVD
jgi:opacity protein-like surface antigen